MKVYGVRGEVLVVDSKFGLRVLSYPESAYN